MNEVEISQYIIDTLQGVDVVVASGDSFFFYNPDTSIPPDHKFPFVTLVTKDDDYDQFSNLNRPGIFRLNIGVSKQTFRSLFGVPVLPSGGYVSTDGREVEQNEQDGSNYDFTVLDRLIPHPVYGKMYWLSILNPTSETFEAKVQPLLAEAYEMAVTKYNKKASLR